mgnify:FL=1
MAIKLMPALAQANASAEPVLPPVYSMTVYFSVRSPLVRALPITEIAIRSLKDPVGLPLSIFSHTDAQLSASGKFNLIRGV